MRLLGIILVSLFICLSVIAQDVIQDIRISDPGSGGMVTNVGMGELQPNQLRYSMNVDVTRWPGRIRPRLPLRNYGGNDRLLWGAYGYYDPYTKRKVVVGISDSSYVYRTIDTAYWKNDSGFRVDPGTSLDSTVYNRRVIWSKIGHFFVSDTFATTVTNGVDGMAFPLESGYHDWTTHKNLLVHCDGKNTPNIFTTSDGSYYKANTPDTDSYNPRCIPIGLEAPGQLRAAVMNDDGNPDGAYQYSYAYLSLADSAISKMAIPSAPVYPDGNTVCLTGFEDYSSDDTLWRMMLRKKLDGRGLWYVIDSLPPPRRDTVGKVSIVTITAQRRCWSAGVYNCFLQNDTFAVILTADSAGTDVSDTISFKGTAASWRPYQVADSMVSEINAMSGWFDGRVKATVVGNGTHIGTSPLEYYATIAIEGIGASTVIDYYDYDTVTLSYTEIDKDCTHNNLVLDEVIIADASDVSADVVVYVDTLADSTLSNADADTMWLWSSHSARLDTTLYRPGQLHVEGWTSYSADSATWYDRAYDDSSYAIAYSFYDPTTGIESPLSPMLYKQVADTLEGSPDSVRFRQFKTGVPRSGREDWIRLYQGVKQSLLYGGGDTTIWYGLYQMRIGDTSVTITWGQWQDAQVVLGLDTSKIHLDTIYDHQVFYGTVLGDPVVFPPYIYDNQIPFSDIEKYGSRFYGIGDPENSSAIYWSGHDTVWNWNPYNYFLLDSDVNDELVALEKTTRSLFAFKHNSIWRLGGSDPQYSMSVDKMTDAVGAVSRETVVKRGDDIYFLSPALDVYKLNDGGLSMISQPVRNQVADSIFDMKYATASSYGRLYILGDEVIIQNDNTAEMIGYNFKGGVWGNLNMESDYVPLGTFRYDSTEGTAGFGYYSDLLYMDSAIPFVSQERVSVLGDQNEHCDWAVDIPVPSDGKTFMQVVGISGVVVPLMPASQTHKLYYTIYDGSMKQGVSFGDSLVSDSMTFSFANLKDMQDIFRWDVEPHEPSVYPFVRLWMRGGSNVVSTLEIEDLTFSVRYMGRVAAE